MKKDDLWKQAIGESSGTWGGFCAEVLKCPTVTADHRADNYEFYIMGHQFTEAEVAEYDAYALYYITIHGKNKRKEQIKELMETSLLLARRDFIDTLKGTDCEHQRTHEEEETFIVCEVCKKKLMRKRI